jgi:uncharacterized protein YabE (DUF348 family)
MLLLRLHKTYFIFFILIIIFTAYGIFLFFSTQKNTYDFSREKIVYLNDNGLDFIVKTSAKTIQDVLDENNIKLSDNDETVPAKDATIFSGAKVEIRRTVNVKIQVDGKTIENWTLQKNILGTILENNLRLGRLDKVSPDILFSPRADTPIIITRINVEEKVIAEDIDFKIITNTDNKLGWREKKITQEGAKGVREVKYRITYKNGKEITRIVLEKNITKEPVTQIATQGTFMKLGKAAKGQGTWYAYQGGMFAASTSLPRGSYAKVTNTANGKSVVVQINDYGPQGKGRIIDLDKVAFQKIAPIGAGVIGVKVEPVLN